jgi:energy-coupling factor transporter ATP-binding protein EcfA2
MKVTSLKLKNFTVFRDEATIPFCSGINVLIGANGTGKSHVLKMVYSVLKANEEKGSEQSTPALQFDARIAAKLAGVFKPDEGGINRLVSRQQGKASADVTLDTTVGSASFRITGKNNLINAKNSLGSGERSIFLPSREALAMYEGFVPAYENRELSFDETYKDLCVSLSGTQLRGPREKTAKKLIEPLEKLIGGYVRLRGNRFYVIFDDGGEVEAHLVAEGWRKLGSVAQLVMNGSLMQNGFFFWDEPEANLNPRAVKTVVEMLTHLAREGVQVFISSHDYLLTNVLSLLMEYGAESRPDIQFIGLSKPDSSPSRGMQVQIGKTLPEIQDNPIVQEFYEHYQRESRAMEVASPFKKPQT